jgi:integrase
MAGLQGVKGLYEKQGWFYFQPPTPRANTALGDAAATMPRVRPKPVNLHARDLGTAMRNLEQLRMDSAVERAVMGGTLKEVLPQYFASKREDALVTRRSREWILNEFMRATGNPKAADLSTALIERWRTELATRPSRAGQDRKRPAADEEGSKPGSNGGAKRLNVQTQEEEPKGKPLSGTTIKTYTICLRAFVNWLLEQKILRADPMAKLKRQTRVSTTRRHQFLTEQERERLLAAEMLESTRLVLMLGFFAGLRDGEMLAMTPDWLWLAPDGSRGSVVVQETPIQFTDGKRGLWRPKTRQCRTIPLHPRLLAFLRSYGMRRPWMLAPEKELWPDETKNAKRFDAKKALAGVAKRAGVTGLNFHILRHSFATHLAMKGVPLAEIAGLLGDSLRVTEDHYAGFCPNKVNPLEVL